MPSDPGYQFSHHAHTFSVMSDTPSSFACFVATVCVAFPKLETYHDHVDVVAPAVIVILRIHPAAGGELPLRFRRYAVAICGIIYRRCTVTRFVE